MKMSKECLECHEPFNGRVDKKFCCDTCRNCYNNKIKMRNSNHMRMVNCILRKNRRILEELVPEKTAKASRTKLLLRGFNFSYHTSIHTNRRGVNYFFCYEYGYMPMEKDYCILIKREDVEEL